MAKNPGVIKLVLQLHNQGYSVTAIARVLNLTISEIADIINVYK
jgi:DNA-binding NarL/FixJ family response regulator